MSANQSILWVLLLSWHLSPMSTAEGVSLAGTPEKVNTAKKSLEGMVQITATISQESRQAAPVGLSLQLKNLGKEIIVFRDDPTTTFSVKVYAKDGALIPSTRYFKWLMEGPKDTGRVVNIELALNKQAGATLPLERLFDLSLVGDYVVSVEARYTVKGVHGKIGIENLPFQVRSTPFVRIAELK